MAVPNNYIDKIKKDGDSRMISPAADMVRVDNDNFEGTDLDEVLDEVAQAIGEAGEGGYAPPAGGIPKTDLSQDVQTSLGKADTALQSFTETDPTVPSWAKQPTKPTYTAQEVGALPANTTIPTKTSDLDNDSGFVTEDEMESAIEDAGSGAVSVTTNQDGTFVIHVGDTDYTINLNHTHENMAKLVVCEESDLPSTLEEDTIYGVEEDGEISVLYVGGIPFYGGGGGGTSTPVLRQPTDGSTIDVGKIASGESSVTKTITVKGKNLTQALTVAVTGTGYSVNKQSISAADANAGTTLVITCTSTSYDAAGTLSIASSEVSCDCDMIANKATYESLTAVKLNGTQWMKTDYYVNANSKVSMRLKFTENSHSPVGSVSDKYFLTCKGKNTSGNYNYAFYCYISQEGNELIGLTTTPVTSVLCPNLFKDNSVLDIYGTTMKFTPGDGSSAVTGTLSQAIASMPDPLHIGYYIFPTDQSVKIFNVFDLTIYELTISENDVVKRHYVPMTRNGIPGLYDTVTGTFISSETSTELVAVN